MAAQFKQGFFLGFDFGTKRLGLAIGQTVTQTATPLATLNVQKGIPWDQLARTLHEWEPQGLIVGLALQPDNTHSPTSKAALKFGEQLKQRFKLPVYYVNERLTSVAANERIKETSSSVGNDAMAAAIILESWFNSDGKEIVNYVPSPDSI